jgi:aspartyl protease family protein
VQTNAQQTNRNKNKWNGKTVVKMNKKNGVYEVPIEINGSKMSFIFDTGASDITISLTEATFLYKQGALTDDDFLGTQQYQIADGSISEGTIINLKTIKIGNRILSNVQASIVHNMVAPLLFGQSALAQFGKVTIDYNRGEITFE